MQSINQSINQNLLEQERSSILHINDILYITFDWYL